MKVLAEIQNGSKIYITSRGKVVAKLVPPDDKQENARKKLKEIGKKAKLHDIVSPVDVQWEAMK